MFVLDPSRLSLLRTVAVDFFVIVVASALIGAVLLQGFHELLRSLVNRYVLRRWLQKRPLNLKVEQFCAAMGGSGVAPLSLPYWQLTGQIAAALSSELERYRSSNLVKVLVEGAYDRQRDEEEKEEREAAIFRDVAARAQASINSLHVKLRTMWNIFDYGIALALSALFAKHLFYLSWPGDVLRKTKPHRYFVDNVRNAREAGKILAKFLNDESCEFIIVAHSLGCWLTAEMMAELHRLNPSVCRNFKLILMAGAVPTVDVENRQLYGAGLASTPHVSNLYSPDDTVLRDWFPLGLIPDRGRGLEAIGLNGKPISFGWSQREQMKKFGHSDYWPKPASAEFLARLLGVPVPVTLPAHDIPSYYPPEYRPASTDDESPFGRNPPSGLRL